MASLKSWQLTQSSLSYIHQLIVDTFAIVPFFEDSVPRVHHECRHPESVAVRDDTETAMTQDDHLQADAMDPSCSF